MSAKLLRVKQMQNQLSETQMQLNELMNENRILRNMQKRQEGALKRYEGNHAELPQMIRLVNYFFQLKISTRNIGFYRIYSLNIFFLNYSNNFSFFVF